MVGTSNGHGFLDNNASLNDENLEFFGEHGTAEAELLQQCNSHYAMDTDQKLIEFSMGKSGMDRIEPYTGMTFPSLDEARDFYYEYAKQTGFTLRTNRIRHSLKDMAVIGRDFVCSREGFRAAKHAMKKDRVLPPRPVTREGCKAMIRLAARDGGKWVVTKFVCEHNHKLMTPKFPGELTSVNILSEEEKDKKIRDLSDELHRERQRSAALQQQLHMILSDLEEYGEFMSLRVEDVVNSLKSIEIGDS